MTLYNLTGIIPYIKAEKSTSSSGRQKSTL